MSEPLFDQHFRQTRREVDDVLADVPQSLLEARRVLTRELEFEPRPEELQLIVKIAGFMSTSMACFEMPRQMLALRVLAEREWNRFSASRHLDPSKLAEVADNMASLLEAYEQAVQDFTVDSAAFAGLEPDERSYLSHVRDALAIPVERLQSVAILAPRLELMAKQIASGNITETFPSLSEREVEMFNQAVHLEQETDASAGRICLDAVALRTIYEEYCDVWDRSGYLDDAELVEQLHGEIRAQLQEVETAYRVLGDTLQKQQDEAISASLEDFAEEIRDAKSRLFEAYVESRPLLREPQVVEVGGGARSLEQTLQEVDRVEQAVGKMKTRDEIYLDALTNMRNSRAAERDQNMHPLVRKKARRRRRRLLLIATLGALAASAVGIHLVLPKPLPDPVTITLKEFPPAFAVIEAKPIGTMLYARVTDWDRLTVDKIRFRTAGMGELALAKDLKMVYVVSDLGRPVAEWHSNGGVIVHAKEAQADDVVSTASDGF